MVGRVMLGRELDRAGLREGMGGNEIVCRRVEVAFEELKKY